MKLPRITRKSRDALNDRCQRFSSDSIVVQESPRESLVRDHYFVSGIGPASLKDLEIQLRFNQFFSHYTVKNIPN